MRQRAGSVQSTAITCGVKVVGTIFFSMLFKLLEVRVMIRVSKHFKKLLAVNSPWHTNKFQKPLR